MQLGSPGLQHADERLEGDERVVLILDTRRDVETRQEWLRVSAELPDQVAVSPQIGRADQAAHRSTPWCREMIKDRRKMSRPMAAPSTILFLQRHAKTAGKEPEEERNAQRF